LANASIYQLRLAIFQYLHSFVLGMVFIIFILKKNIEAAGNEFKSTMLEPDGF